MLGYFVAELIMKRAWQGLSQKTMYKTQSCEFHSTNNLD
ncbi:MAG: hypothetical protein JG782_1506 [Anaerophaga sp.]|nr:hypothetical protein [Anaerophaga sp.]MDN5292648.1 hypothetical protein [Anaerophaga sp.]